MPHTHCTTNVKNWFRQMQEKKIIFLKLPLLFCMHIFYFDFVEFPDAPFAGYFSEFFHLIAFGHIGFLHAVEGMAAYLYVAVGIIVGIGMVEINQVAAISMVEVVAG